MLDRSFALYVLTGRNTSYFNGSAADGSGALIGIGPASPTGLFVSAQGSAPRLSVGTTPQAFFPFDSSNAGTLDETYCRPSNGAFVVHEVDYGTDGTLLKLAADFSAACTMGYMTNMTGAVRFNSSVPAALTQTFAIPGVDHAVTEGAVVVLDGSLSWNPSSRVTGLVWKQISGPSFDLSACQTGTCRTYAPLVAPGGSAAIFELTATSESGVSATASLKLDIRSWRDTQSRVDILGNGYAASGSNLGYTERDGPFEVPVKSGTESIYLDQTIERVRFLFHGNATYGFQPMVPPSLVLSNAVGNALVPGIYSGTARAGFEPMAVPALDFSFGGRECNSPVWTAAVAALDRNPADLTQVSRAAIWFQEQCAEGGLESEASYGRFWINYTPVQPPIVAASGPASVKGGDAFTVRDAGSATPAGTALVQVWRQVFGTPVDSLTVQPDGSLQAVASASTPAGSSLVFSYELIDSLGQSGVTLVQVPVQAATATTQNVRDAGGKRRYGAVWRPVRPRGYL